MREQETRIAPYACGDRTTRMALLVAYSVSHFCVDMACAMLVLGAVVPMVRESHPDAGVWLAPVSILLYNMMAFAFQLPIGAVADRLDDNPKVSAYGCVTVAVAYLVTLVSPVLAAIVVGVGNAMFHVGGGIDMLNVAGTRRADLPGVFVSTGAVGLFCGINWADLGLPMPELPISLMCACGMSLVMVGHLVRRRGEYVSNAVPEPEFRGMPRPVLMVLAGMFVTVVIRSMLGTVVAFPWKTGLAFGLANVLCVAGGKALGGIVGDRIGWRRTAMASLPVASVLFLLSYDSMPLGLLAMLLFNMTMPLTLTVLADTFRHNKGVAFGITTVALFLGSLTAGVPFLSTPAGVALMSLASFLTIMVGFRGYEDACDGLRFADGRWQVTGKSDDGDDDGIDAVAGDETTDNVTGLGDVGTEGVAESENGEMDDGTPDGGTDETADDADEHGDDRPSDGKGDNGSHEADGGEVVGGGGAE